MKIHQTRQGRFNTISLFDSGWPGQRIGAAGDHPGLPTVFGQELDGLGQVTGAVISID
jgi:hypothetical protein